MKYNFSEKQIEQLKSIVDRALEERSFHVDTTLEQGEDGRGDTVLVLKSEQFYTVPSIHRNLHIENFGGCVYEDEQEDRLIHISIPVSVRYDSNGTSLFTVHAIASKLRPDFIDLDTIHSKF